MKTLTPAMQAHLAGAVTTLATCWRIKRRDDQLFYFTDHDADILYDGQVYVAAASFTRTAVDTKSGTGVDNMDVAALIDDEQVTERDLRMGLFDGAEVWVFLVNWQNPEHGHIALRRGFIGEVVTQHNGTYAAQLMGLLNRIDQRFIDFYSPICRADLGDAKCGVDIVSAGVTGSVSAVTSASQFFLNLDAPLDDFTGGHLNFTTGANAGGSYEVHTWISATGTATLFLAALYPVEIGDTFTLTPGCNKHFTTCRDKFDNAVNFRGEPFLPGSDMLGKYPGPDK